MKFYYIYNKDTLDKKEMNKVFLCEEAAKAFTHKLNTKTNRRYEYEEFEYILSEEEAEKYRTALDKLNRKRSKLLLQDSV